MRFVAVFAVVAAIGARAENPFNAPGTPRHYHREHPCDFVHERLDITVDVKKQHIAGTAAITFVLTRPSTTLELDASDGSLCFDPRFAGGQHRTPERKDAELKWCFLGIELAIKVTS